MGDLKGQETILATVSEVTPAGIKLKFDGEDEATEKAYPCNSSIPFAAGDRVKITRDSGTCIVEFKLGAPGADYPMPAGGTTGQVLQKKSNNDNDTEWGDPPDGLPDDGTKGQVLVKVGYDNSPKWVTLPVNTDSSTQLGFFNSFKKANQRSVSKIISPNIATASQVATAFNDLLDALKAYNLLS